MRSLYSRMISFLNLKSLKKKLLKKCRFPNNSFYLKKNSNKDFQDYQQKLSSGVINNFQNINYNEHSLNISNGYLKNYTFILNFFPFLYLICSLAIILLVFINFNTFPKTNTTKFERNEKKTYKLNVIENNSFENFIMKFHNQTKKEFEDIIFSFPNFFEIKNIFPNAFNIYVILSSVSSLAIVLILFFILKQRFRVPEYQIHHLKINVMLILGLVANFLNISKTVCPLLLNHYFFFVKDINPFLELNLNNVLFVTHIICYVFYSIYSLFILNLMKVKKSDIEGNGLATQIEIQSNLEKWLNFKCFILIILTTFLVVYLYFLLSKNYDLILCFGFFKVFFEKYLNFVLRLLPYTIHFLNSILIFTLIFDLKFFNFYFAQNIDVLYLFEQE